MLSTAGPSHRAPTPVVPLPSRRCPTLDSLPSTVVLARRCLHQTALRSRTVARGRVRIAGRLLERSQRMAVRLAMADWTHLTDAASSSARTPHRPLQWDYLWDRAERPLAGAGPGRVLELNPANPWGLRHSLGHLLGLPDALKDPIGSLPHGAGLGQCGLVGSHRYSYGRCEAEETAHSRQPPGCLWAVRPRGGHATSVEVPTKQLRLAAPDGRSLTLPPPPTSRGPTPRPFCRCTPRPSRGRGSAQPKGRPQRPRSPRHPPCPVVLGRVAFAAVRATDGGRR